MKFLLDENFPKSAEKLLIELGHQVIDIRGTDLQGIDDFRLFEVAQDLMQSIHSTIYLLRDETYRVRSI